MAALSRAVKAAIREIVARNVRRADSEDEDIVSLFDTHARKIDMITWDDRVMKYLALLAKRIER